MKDFKHYYMKQKDRVGKISGFKMNIAILPSGAEETQPKEKQISNKNFQDIDAMFLDMIKEIDAAAPDGNGTIQVGFDYATSPIDELNVEMTVLKKKDEFEVSVLEIDRDSVRFNPKKGNIIKIQDALRDELESRHVGDADEQRSDDDQ